jgi:hypothetical protein
MTFWEQVRVQKVKEYSQKTMWEKISDNLIELMILKVHKVAHLRKPLQLKELPIP